MQDQNNTINDYRFAAGDDPVASQKPNIGAAVIEEVKKAERPGMNKFSSKLTNARSRLLDAEALLHHLHQPENLDNFLENCSPEVTLGAMIDKAWSLVAEASGDVEAMEKTHNDDFLAELKQSAGEARDYIAQFNETPSPDSEGVRQKPTLHIEHIDTLDEIHEQSQSMLDMLMLHCRQANEGGESLTHSVLENYVSQLRGNMERARVATTALNESFE